MIGSVHVIESTDPAAGKLFIGRSDEEGYRVAMEETLTDIREFDGFDVLGHLVMWCAMENIESRIIIIRNMQILLMRSFGH